MHPEPVALTWCISTLISGTCLYRSAYPVHILPISKGLLEDISF
jgi:hypothetical protein